MMKMAEPAIDVNRCICCITQKKIYTFVVEYCGRIKY